MHAYCDEVDAKPAIKHALISYDEPAPLGWLVVSPEGSFFTESRIAAARVKGASERRGLKVIVARARWTDAGPQIVR